MLKLVRLRLMDIEVEEDASYRAAFQADAKAAAEGGKGFFLGCIGPALEKHEALYFRLKTQARAIEKTLMWALGELPDAEIIPKAE